MYILTDTSMSQNKWFLKYEILQMSTALPPSQNWDTTVEQRLNLQYLCLIALGGTQPGTTCLGIARYISAWPA